MILKKGKVSKHTQSYKGKSIKYPRLTITGPKLQRAGFEIGDPIVFKLLDDGRIVIEKQEIETE